MTLHPVTGTHMSELDPRLRDYVDLLRRPPGPAAPALARLRTELARQRRRRAPHVIRLSPAGAVAAAALVVVLTSAVWFAALRGAEGPPAGGTDSALVPVQFVLAAADARDVALVGDFNDWQRGSIRLAPGPEGVWSVVLPLAAGRYAYSFVVDGSEWRAGGGSGARVDAFGRPSSVVFVPRPET